jgi:hypothetical protein
MANQLFNDSLRYCHGKRWHTESWA